MSGVLEISLADVYAGYQRDVDILQGVSLTTAGRAVTLVIGPNGAGKSTMLKTAFGFLHPYRGTVALGGDDISGSPPHRVKAFGVSYIPQGITIFPQLTVEENLRMGAWTFRRDKKQVEQRIGRVYDLFPVLYERRRSKANELSGGQAKMLSISKEVVTEPQVMLVDEPTSGLAPTIAAEVYEFLLRTRESFGASVLLVDQNIEDSVEIASYVYLLDLGRVRADGPAEEFRGERIRTLIRESLHG